VITLTRLNGVPFVLNVDLIEQVEKTPDTVITLTTGNNIVVKESVEALVEKTIAYKQKIPKEMKWISQQ
jgi:flagellar protein FlbD